MKRSSARFSAAFPFLFPRKRLFRMSAYVSLLIFAAAQFAGCAAKGTAEYRDGMAACAEAQYRQAAESFHEAALQGHPEAQLMLGLCIMEGYGVEQNRAESVKWLRAAADQGDPDALFFLASCYFKGEGVDRNLTEAFGLIRKAAAKGNVMAQCNLGFCYEEGKGIGQDKAEAVKWYRQVAKRSLDEFSSPLDSFGEKESDAVREFVVSFVYRLGSCCEHGEGVARDLDEAVKWYRAAADRGNADARKALIRLGLE